MEVRQSEFARMCGVSDMAISLMVKKGKLTRSPEMLIDTDISKNKSYLEKHLKKVYRKNHGLQKGGEFDIFEGLNNQTELGCSIYTKEGKEAIAACQSLIKYIEKLEQRLALQENIVRKPIEPSALYFLQSLTESIVQTKVYDDMRVHDAMLYTLNEEYRLPYLNMLRQSQNQKQLQTNPGY